MIGLVRRPWVRALGVLAVIAVAVGLYLFQPWRLFTDRTVDEAAPVATAQPAASPSTPAPSGPQGPQEPQGPRTLSAGRFIDHEHATSGAARILSLPDGSRVLRIENLDTSDGPDLRVWLSDQPVRSGTAGWGVFDDGKYVDLGALKGNKGSQNYPIPRSADLDRLTSVSVWCRRFHVSFGAAALK